MNYLKKSIKNQAKIIDFVKEFILKKRKVLNLRGFYKVLVYVNKNIGVLYESIKLKIQNYRKGSNGSIVKFITKDDVAKTKIYYPKDEKSLNAINSNLDLINKLNIENEELNNFKNFLLPLLMNGQIGFKDKKIVV